MARRDSNLNIGITSTFDGRGFKSAEGSAKAMERELNKLEQHQRRSAQMQMQAQREMQAEFEAQAAARERINDQQRAAMESTGKWMLGISAAAAAGLALTAKAAIDWESAWAGVTKTVDGTDAQLDALEGDLRRMARSLPATHTEIAAVAEAAGQLGVATEDVAAFSETMIHLGETTNMTADEAATAIAQFSNIMGTSTDDVDRLGSTVVALGNNSATTERNIVLMSQRIAGSAAIIGMTEADTLGLAAALSSVGIEVEAGGTAISRVMTDIAQAVDLGGEELQAFADVAGMSADDFATAFRENPTDAIITFIEGLNRIDEAGGSVFQTLDDMGLSEVRVSRALLGMANSGDLLRESVDLGNQAWEENIALIEEANQRYQTTESRLQMARNQINDAAIDIGGNFLPMVADAAEVVGSLATAFGNLPEGVQRWVTYLGAAATGVGALGGAALIAVPKLHEFRKTVDALHGGSSRLGRMAGGLASVLTGPWGLAIAGATIGVITWAKAQGDAAQMTQSLADTLDAQTGALTANSTAWIQSELTKDQSFGIRNTQSMAEAAREMGISIETLTAAYEGQPEAIAAAKAAADEWAAENDNLALTASSQADRFNRNLDDQAQRLEDARRIQEEKLSIDEAATEQQHDLADGLDASGLAAEAAADGQDMLADVMGETTDEAEALQEALDAIVEAMHELNNPTLDLIDAQMAWEATLDEVNGQLEEYGQNLDITTEKGRANQEFLNGMARDAMALAEALLQETDSEVQFRASLVESREALAETAERFGMSEEAAWEYVNSVLAIPPTAETTVDAHTGNAEHAINDLLVGLNAADGTITINGEATNAQATLGEIVGDVNEADGTVTINGETFPADQTLGEYLARVMEAYAEANVGADMSPADRTVGLWVPDEKTGSVEYVPWMQEFDPPNYRRQIIYEQRIERGQALPPDYDRPMADGGILQFFASGGVRENHVAQIAPAGAWRVWAEPETGGEAYIPLAPAKRQRSEEILGEVAHRFGMYVGRFANGGIVGGAAPAASTPGVVNNIYGVPVDSAEETARALAWELRRLPAVTGYAGGSS